MRRSRQLTSAEQWDLGLLLALFMVSALVAAAVWRTNTLPKLWAFAVQPAADAPRAVAQPQATPAHLSPAAVMLSPSPPPAPTAPTSAPARTPKLIATPAKPKEDIRIYNGEKYQYVRTLRMRVTAYAPDRRCCWPYPGTTTASGLSVRTNGGRLVAADTRVIPLHSLVMVPGYNGERAVPVLDRGGAIKGNRLDVLLPTFSAAEDWGTKVLDVKVYAPVD